MAGLMKSDNLVDDKYIDLLHTHLSHVPEWMNKAACLDIEEDSNENILSACKKCPVIDECLSYAMDNNVSSGVFGGKTFPISQ